MEDRADELIKKIETAPNDLALIRKLKELQSEIFFRVSIIKDETQVIYDSHKRHLLGPRFSHEYIVDNKEVADAFEYGVGRNEDFGGIYDQKFTFFAKAFPFHQKTYVMRTAFPSRYLSDLKEDLEIGFLALTIVMLLLFCIMTWLIISHFTRPIHHIIRAIASHELKTPTTIIHGFAEMLYEHPELKEEIKCDMIAKIVKNSTRMTVLIRDLLTLSDIDNLPLSRLQTCDLKEIVKDCFHILQDKFKVAIFTLTAGDEEMTLVADHSLLELAMMNLIENGAKYSKGIAHIDVSLKHTDRQIEVKVKDQGIGIPAEDLEFIFDRFITVNKAHSKGMGGSGLGLSIVQTIIQKHFGQISVTSEVGKGTTFTIYLPYAA